MSDTHHCNYVIGVVHGIDHSVVADSNSPRVLQALELLCSGGPGALLESEDLGVNSGKERVI